MSVLTIGNIKFGRTVADDLTLFLTLNPPLNVTVTGLGRLPRFCPTVFTVICMTYYCKLLLVFIHDTSSVLTHWAREPGRSPTKLLGEQV